MTRKNLASFQKTLLELVKTKKMKIVGICGSPRKGGNTEIMVREALRGAKEGGAETELIRVGELKIEFCDGCLRCEENGCSIEDDMVWVNQKLVAADGFIFGTPARWDLLSAQLKLFFERMSPIAPDDIRGKKAVILSVGELKGREGKDSVGKVIESVEAFCIPAEIKVVGKLGATGVRSPGEIKKQPKVLRECYKLGQELVEGLEQK